MLQGYNIFNVQMILLVKDLVILFKSEKRYGSPTHEHTTVELDIRNWEKMEADGYYDSKVVAEILQQHEVTTSFISHDVVMKRIFKTV